MTHADRLADVLWYLKGYIDASEHAAAVCIFDQEHIEALQEAHRGLSVPITTAAVETEQRGRELPSYCTCRRPVGTQEPGPHHRRDCPRCTPSFGMRLCTCYSQRYGVYHYPGPDHVLECACYSPMEAEEERLQKQVLGDCICATGRRLPRPGPHHTKACPRYTMF